MKKIIFLFLLLPPMLNIQAQFVEFDITKTKIDKEILELLCDSELNELRNEIYARHGFVFTNPKYKELFEQCDWYKPAPSNSQITLNELETQNANILREEEEKRSSRKKAIKTYFNDLKNKLNSNPLQLDRENQIILKEVLNYINFNDMTYCGSNGRHRTAIDNGYSETAYAFDLFSNNIRLARNFNSSDLFPGRERVKAGINSDDIGWQVVGEYGEFILFKIDDNNNITFEGIGGAG